MQRDIFHQNFCELLENSSSASKYVPKIFIKYTKKHQWRSLMLVKLQAFIKAEQPPNAFCKKVFLERCSQNSQEKACVKDSILIKLHCYGCTKETLAQGISCEFRKISKNTFFTERLRFTASAFSFSEAATGGVL